MTCCGVLIIPGWYNSGYVLLCNFSYGLCALKLTSHQVKTLFENSWRKCVVSNCYYQKEWRISLNWSWVKCVCRFWLLVGGSTTLNWYVGYFLFKWCNNILVKQCQLVLLFEHYLWSRQEFQTWFQERKWLRTLKGCGLIIRSWYNSAYFGIGVIYAPCIVWL